MSRIKEPPIFSKHRINFNPSFPLTHLCVANNNLILAMQNKVLLRVDLKSNPEEPQEIDFLKTHSPAADAKISNMYLDPSGQHLFITFAPRDAQSPSEVMCLNSKSMIPKEIPKLTSHSITAVAWSPTQLEEFSKSGPAGTGLQPILVGTSKGLVFEVEITASGEVKVSKQLFDIGKGNPAFICGLEYFFVPRSNKCFILVATSKKLYQFHGFVSSKDDRPLFANIFNSYLSQSNTEEVLEFSEPNLYSHHVEQYSLRLNVLYDNVTGAPKCLGYLTDNGSLVFKDVVNSTSFDTILKDVKMIPYENMKDKTIAVPKSILVTDYHVALLQKNTIKGICALNEEMIFEDVFDENGVGKIMNIVRDSSTGLIWFFTERSVHKYTIHREDRNIWKIYLAKQDFAKAQEASKGDVTKMEAIAMGQADYYFAKKEYEQSAMYYALTRASFEEIALKFVQIDDSYALKTFLLKKLSSLQPFEATKVSVLVLWILEIYLNQLGTLRDFGKHDTPEYHNLEEEFLKFMGEKIVTDCVKKNKKAVYDLMSSHGDRENLIHFTLVMKDYDEVIEESIATGHYENALRTLQNQKDPALYSKFIPILLDKDPAATINVLISGGRMLNPMKLLPKFSSKLDKDTAREVTRYLEHCANVLRIPDKAVYDYLLALYIHYYDPAEKLMPYLHQQGSDVDHVRYDPKYGLNMCLERKLYKPAVHLYTIMGLYEEAIALAIQIDLELAKKTANVPEQDEELRKKLWLRIAKHVVKEKNDIQQAMEFLQQCDLLKIEDILPFFPNFVTIDHFKDAICASLQEYNRHIQNLKDEMEEATKSAEVIREEIQNVRSRCAIVKATDQCTICSVPLLIRNFYVFPCGHNFHADCLLGEVFPLLSQPRKALLSELQKKLEELALRQDAMSTESGGISVRDQVKSEVDDIIASECIYCGDHMIKLIDVPFIPDEDYDRVQREWD